MTLQPPPIEPRRASALRAALDEIAASVAPDWYGPGREGTFGRALVEIAARMGEETTRRLELTPRRDALAFFDALDIASAAPQAAEATIVFALTEDRDTPVLAPARLKVSAAAEPDEVAFETDAALPLTPARLVDLVSVDPELDKLERASKAVLVAAAPDVPITDYTVVGFADSGSRILQLNPVLGIEPDDLMRIGDAVYRVQELDGDLVTLADSLESPVAEGASARKLTDFEVFDQRDLQHHAFYMGHLDLFNLEQRASIDLCFTPASVARELSNLNISYSLWGTLDEETAPAWHELIQIGSAGGVVSLIKDWVGTVDETEVSGQNNRWLRAELLDPMLGPAAASVQAARLEVQVESIADPTRPVPPNADAEGSQTVDAAFHNASALGVSGRFLPFGPEPRRFDTFAVAAPEAFSKRGAEASLNITLVDSSIGAVAVPLGSDGSRAYGVGRNGKLQLLTFDSATELRWQELNAPSSPSGDEVLLADSVIHAVSLPGGGKVVTDLLVVADRGGSWWSTKMVHNPSVAPSQPKWSLLEKPTFAAATDGQALDEIDVLDSAAFFGLPQAGPLSSAMLVLADGGGLHALTLDSQGDVSGDWKRTVGGESGPKLTRPARVVPFSGTPPIVQNDLDDIDVVVLDAAGEVWHVMVDSADFTLGHKSLGGEDSRRAALDVAPAATFFETGDTTAKWVTWALAGDHSVVGVTQVGMGDAVQHTPLATGPSFEVPKNGRLLSDPAALPSGDSRPAVAALGVSAGTGVAMTWSSGDELKLTPLPVSVTVTNEESGETSVPSASFLIPPSESEPPYLAFAAPGESVFLAAIGDPDRTVGVALRDGLTLSALRDAEYLILYDGSESSEGENVKDIVPLDLSRRIQSGREQVYEIEPGLLEAGQDYRLLAAAGRPDPPYRGKIDPLVVRESEPTQIDPRNKIILDSRDDDTERGDYLLIGVDLYQIIADQQPELDEEPPEGRTVELDRPLPSNLKGSFIYSVFYKISNERVEVQTGDLGTLLKLADLSRAPDINTRMEFGSGLPRSQKLALTGRFEGEVWVKVAEPWQERPFDNDLPSEATLVGELIVNPGWIARGPDRLFRNPELSWEFFDGDGWRQLNEGFSDTTGNLLNSGTISFTVPDTMAETSVGGQENFWIRARLVGGDYGQAVTVITSEVDPGNDDITTQTVEFNRSGLRPPEIAAIEAEFKDVGPQLVESLQVVNNLSTIDQTQAAAVESARFELFENAASLDPEGGGRTLYLGFDKPIAVNPLTLFVEVQEQLGRGALTAEVLAATGWRAVTVLDETESLRRRGLVTVFLNDEAVLTRLFGSEGYWIRIRPEVELGQASAADDWKPVLSGLFPNAVTASQATTIDQEILGTSIGEPSLSVTLSDNPVLPDTLELRVREQLSIEEIQDLEAEQIKRGDAGFGPRPEPLPVTASLVDAPGLWVLWRRVDSFAGYDGDARVFRLDPGTGTVTFGDGRRGKIPPPGRDSIRAFRYQQGGGFIGNLPAWTELSLSSSLESVELVAMPIDSAGGVDQPAGELAFADAPDRLRHAGQALTPIDIEALAVASSPDIVTACCFFPVGATDPVRVVIAQRTGERCPQPTAEVRDVLSRRLAEVGWGGLPVEGIVIDGPTYVRVAVTVEITARADRVGQVEESAKRALTEFLDPINGGPDGGGWPFGRQVWPSDVLRILESVNDVDRVQSFDLTFLPSEDECCGPENDQGNETGPVPLDGLICALPDDIDVRVEPSQEIS